MVARLLALLAMAVLAACASDTAPRSVAQATQTVKLADEAGAGAGAPLEMQVAREKLSAAQKAVVAEKMTEADRLAREAIVNAELAQAKAEDARSRAALGDMQRAAEAARRAP